MSDSCDKCQWHDGSKVGSFTGISKLCNNERWVNNGDKVIHCEYTYFPKSKVKRDDGHTCMKLVEQITPEQLAELFHRNYERLAPAYGYKTKAKSSVEWVNVPLKNKNLMIATSGAVLKNLLSELVKVGEPQ